MLSPAQPDRIHVVFDDHRLVANAGLLLPVTLAHHLGLGELVDCHVDLGDAPGRANAGDKMLTLVASALAGGDCIDDADALRAGGTARVLGCVVQAPSTLGTFLRSFRWGPRAATGPGEPGVAGPGVGRRGRTRRRSVDHRPGLHPLRDLRAVQGGSAPPWVHRPARLSPDPRRGRGHRRRADGTAAPRAAPTRPAAPPTSCGRRWAGCAMPEPPDHSPCGPTAASTPMPSSPPAER